LIHHISWSSRKKEDKH
jgi:hypothetical protein